MGIRDYLKDPAGKRGINRAIRSAFERRRGGRPEAGRILVVDDDPLTRETLVRTLERASYRVVGAADGREAVGLFDAHPFDLVVTEATHERLRTESTAASPRREPGLKILNVASSRTYTLSKPYDTDQLLRAIKDALGD